MVALNLEDAYKRVIYKVIMRTLRNMDVDQTLIMLIGAALLKRKATLELGTWASEVIEISP